MNQEAIEKLRQFQIKNHLSGYNLENQADSQVEVVSISEDKPKRAINYPAHIKPLQDRIMSAVGNGCRTSQAITTYCGEDAVKVVNMHLGRLLSAGKLVRYTNPASSITRYYTPDEAKAKGYKPDAQVKKGKKAKGKKVKFVKPRASDIVNEEDPRQMPLWGETASNLATAEQLMQHEALKKHCTFLENQVRGWQAESRKQAHEIEKLQKALVDARKTRDVTSEVTEVMQEVTQLRATIAYLESKLFGSK
jgi:hypothetical protein